MWSLLSTRIFYHLGYAYTTSKRIPKPLHQSDLKLSTSEESDFQSLELVPPPPKTMC